MNYSDSERFASVLDSLGFVQTPEISKADVIIINSCSVRQKAEDRVIGMRRKAKKLKLKKPNLIVILTGCMTKREARLEKDAAKKLKVERRALAELKKNLPWVDYFLHVEELDKLPEIFNQPKISIEDYFSIPPKYNSRFQAFVPISTGCNNFCSYCIVSFTRGREKSRSYKEIVQEARNLIKKRYKEVTLLGQNINSYNDNRSEQKSFCSLLREIDKIDGDFWIRFISSHPKDISDELIETLANGRHLVPYLHFALQSGNNNVLRKMNRPYTVEKYLEIVDKIRNKIPQVAITTDIIVGFPGETDSEFEDTKRVMEKVGFAMAYLNEYSPRKGTRAYEMEDDVPNKIKTERKAILNEVLKKSCLDYNSQFLNKKFFVLFERIDDNRIFGHNAQGVNVQINEKRNDLVGKFAEVEITKAGSWGMEGKLCNE